VWYLLELMGARLLARAELARALAGDVAENPPESAETVPAGLECVAMIGVSESRSSVLARSMRRVSR
jgi:hypothetical protein